MNSITYYEMISFLEKLKKAPKDENNIVFLQTHNTYTPGNVLYRVIDHVTNVIRYRLTTSLDNFTYKLKSTKKDENLFSLEVIEIKKEIAYCLKISNNITIPEENKNKLKETIQNYANEIEDILEESATNVDPTGKLLSIIKNHNLNKLEG